MDLIVFEIEEAEIFRRTSGSYISKHLNYNHHQFQSWCQNIKSANTLHESSNLFIKFFVECLN